MRRRAIVCSILFLSINLANAATPVPTELTGVSKKQEPAEVAQSPWTGSLTITNNYVYRGLTQTSNLPAFEGSLTGTWLKYGLYANLWGSNVNQVASDGAQATLELDTIVGIGNEINDDWSYNISLERYNYPRANHIAYNEGIGVLTYKILSLTFAYSANEFNTHASGYYYALSLSYDIPEKYLQLSGVNVAGTVGYYKLNPISGQSYANFLVGVSKDFGIYNLAFQLSDTDHQADHRDLGGLYWIALLTASF